MTDNQKKTNASSLYIGSKLLRMVCWLAGLITIGSLGLIVVYICVRGIPYLTPELFALEYNSENVSMFHAIINTLSMTGLALLFSVPVGVFGGIYLAEHAKPGSKIVKLVRVTAETLSGIPSIIYGLFGMMAFVVALKMGNSLIAGALTLAIMTLPLILRQTEESLLSVPMSYREGSFGLGAGKLRTTVRQAAWPCCSVQTRKAENNKKVRMPRVFDSDWGITTSWPGSRGKNTASWSALIWRVSWVLKCCTRLLTVRR